MPLAAQDELGPEDFPGINPFGSPDPNRPVGLTVSTDDVNEGYILLSIVQSKDTILIDNTGRVVNIWESDYYPSNSAYLLENGNLLRTAAVTAPENSFGFDGQWGFVNGRFEEYTWDGELVNAVEYYSDDYIGHHDFELLPNGNILLAAFERFTEEEALAAGRDPALMPEEGELWGEKVVEIDRDTGEVVWEWRLWDHLVQDYNPDAENYGVVADNPGKIDMNFHDATQPIDVNYWHINTVDYDPERELIMLSPRTYSEIWIIDHSISTEEARGEAGDLLFRWGNPAAYQSGTDADRYLYFPHDPQWILDGYPGAGNILIYDNGGDERPYSVIFEFIPEKDANGDFVMTPGEPTQAEIVWEYIADPPEAFFSLLISGAQRQINGNTLITEGLNGRVFEVNPAGEIVWEYYLEPTTWPFRGERYDLSALDVDLSQDLVFEGGMIWGQDCADGAQPRLHEYLPHEQADMDLFIDTHGEDAAQAEWEAEACAEHGGIAG